MKVAVWVHRIVSARSFGAAWLSLVLTSIVSLVGCGGSGNETSVEQTGIIAFTVNRSGFGEIWVMGLDGRNRLQLTEPSQEVRSPGAGDWVSLPLVCEEKRMPYSTTSNASRPTRSISLSTLSPGSR